MEARDNSRFGAVILAPGISSPMGEAKQLLRLGENTLLGQVLENVRRSGVKDIVGREPVAIALAKLGRLQHYTVSLRRDLRNDECGEAQVRVSRKFLLFLLFRL